MVLQSPNYFPNSIRKYWFNFETESKNMYMEEIIQQLFFTNDMKILPEQTEQTLQMIKCHIM